MYDKRRFFPCGNSFGLASSLYTGFVKTSIPGCGRKTADTDRQENILRISSATCP